MRINLEQSLVVLGSLSLILIFQNCGQPGSITQSGFAEKGTVTGGGIDPVVVVPPGAQPPPVLDLRYADYSKNVVVANQSKQVDILVVIDNSGSMAFEQKNMGDRFDSFIDQLQGLDWRVGITTTSVAQMDDKTGRVIRDDTDGRLLRMEGTQQYYLSSTDGAQVVKQAFRATIQRKETGSPNEQGIRATYRALERAQIAGSENQKFLRATAGLAVVVVSDADETPFQQMTHRNMGQKLRDYIAETHPSKAFSFHSIIVRRSDQDCLRFPGSQNEFYGLHYQHLSEKTNGIVGSVCEMDYGAQLKRS